MARAQSFVLAYCNLLLLVQSSTAFLLLPPSHHQATRTNHLGQRHRSPALLLSALSESIDYDKDYSTAATTMEDDPDTDDYHATVASSTSEKDSIPSEIASTRTFVLEEDGTIATTTAKKTVIYGIRHGVSVSNEWISLPENTWGAPTFNDDNGNPRDARLSAAGERQAAALAESLLADPPAWLRDIELVVVSPLTRCLQTFQLAVQPALGTTAKKDIPVLAHPWATERVYTISEIGRPARELQREFPDVDFSLCLADDDDRPWWYDPQWETDFNRDAGDWREWRPHAEGQRYAAPGEPKKVFQRRMAAFQRWLEERPEQTIFVTAHWGVFRHYLEGQELDNCQVCRFDLTSRKQK